MIILAQSFMGDHGRMNFHVDPITAHIPSTSYSVDESKPLWVSYLGGWRCGAMIAALHEKHFSSHGSHETSRMKTIKQDVCGWPSHTG